MEIPTLSDVDNVLWRYEKERQLADELKKKIKVSIELDGTVTLRGIDWGNYSSLLTSASLYRYDQEKDFELKIETMKDEMQDETYLERASILERNIISDVLWTLEQRAVLKALDDLGAAAFEKSNKKYNKFEQIYWKYIQPITDFKYRMWCFRRAVMKFFRKLKED